MANSAEFAHSPHTKMDHVAALDVATEFAELIAEHRKLSHDYAALLAQFPGLIPDSPPPVPVERKDGTLGWVAEGEGHRCSLLTVHQPFVRVYWRPDDAGPAHKAANEWRARFYVVMKRLRRLYRSLDRKAQVAPDREAQLHDFPLLRADGAPCGISGADILEAIQTHIEHLADDRANFEPSDALPPAHVLAPAAASEAPTASESLADQFRAWCKEPKKAQKVVAVDLGISKSHLNYILHGHRPISPQLEVKIRALMSNSDAQR